MFAMMLMKLILAASKEFLVYFISSEVKSVILIMGGKSLCKSHYTGFPDVAGFLWYSPINDRSVWNISSKAEHWRRKSGFMRKPKSESHFWCTGAL
jgi:hypothetical protein